MTITELIKRKGLELGFTHVGVTTADDFVDYKEEVVSRDDYEIWNSIDRSRFPGRTDLRKASCPKSYYLQGKSIICATYGYSQFAYPPELTQYVARAYLCRAYLPLQDSAAGIRKEEFKRFIHSLGIGIYEGGDEIPERAACARAGIITYGKNNFAYTKEDGSFNILYKLIDRTDVGHRAISDRRYRVFLFTGASLSWNLIYGIYNGVLGAIYGLSWFGVLCAYYLVLCVMRFSVMPFRAEKGKENREGSLMIFNGLVLILLSFVLSFVILVSITDHVRNSHNMIVMISIAAYTFFVTVLAVKNFIKAHKEKSDFMITVRNISLAAATASMMSLERSMIATFSKESTGFQTIMDAYVGAGGFLIVLFLGISMIVFGAKEKK